MSDEMNDFNAQVIEEFRAHDGVVGGMFEGSPILLLHHTGAKSGAGYISPLVYMPEDENYVIFASRGGAPKHPAWYHNLLAHPETTIEVGTATVPVRADEVTGEERDRLYAANVRRHPQFGEYEKQTAGIRTIPVIRLTPRNGGAVA
jgi:deazaflavin-dependent oxidoreductase (nitroreductase family)